MFLFIACETGAIPDANSTNSSGMVQESGIVDLVDEEMDMDFPSVVLEKQNANMVNATLQTFEGGVVNDGLNVKLIRKGNYNSYLRLVFDTYVWLDGGSHPATSVGHYRVNYNPITKVITVVIEGYRAFSAPFPRFSVESIVEKIYFDDHLDDSGYTFHIKLRDSAEVNVFDLKSPARLVFDIKKL